MSESESEQPSRQWIRRRLGFGLPLLAALSAVCFLGVEEWVKMHGLTDVLFLLPHGNTVIMIMVGGYMVFSMNRLWILMAIFAPIVGTSMATIAICAAIVAP